MGTALLVAAAILVAPQTSSPVSHFDQKVAWAHLVKQVEFGPRFAGTPGHIATRDWLKARLEESCENVRLQPFTHQWSQTSKPVQMWNVVAEQNWQKAKVRVLLLAHWDTRPYANEDPNLANTNKPILGANDGASGVAVLLEVARAIKGRLGDVGIMILLTDGEDLGPGLNEMFLGARHFAANLPQPKPNYGILLDMIGDKDLRIPMEQNSFSHAERLVRAFYGHARSIGLDKTFPYMVGDLISDDHLPLIAAGVPTMDLIDFDYPYWHTLQDTIDKCSPDSLGKVGKAVETWLLKKPPFFMPPK